MSSWQTRAVHPGALFRDRPAAVASARRSSWELQGSSCWRKRPPSELRGEVQRIDAEVSHETSRLSHPSRRGCRVAPYRVGLLSAGAPIVDNSSQGAALIRGFTQRGYKLGRNLAFERRGAEGHIDRLPRLVDELAASTVDVIVTFGYPPALACKQAT